MLTAIPEVAPTNFLLFSISIFLLEQAGSAGAAHTTGRDGVASDSKSVLWRTTNPQRFRPHFGIRPVLDQT
jgi:hypothetical protein